MPLITTVRPALVGRSSQLILKNALGHVILQHQINNQRRGSTHVSRDSSLLLRMDRYRARVWGRWNRNSLSGRRVASRSFSNSDFARSEIPWRKMLLRNLILFTIRKRMKNIQTNGKDVAINVYDITKRHARIFLFPLVVMVVPPWIL